MLDRPGSTSSLSYHKTYETQASGWPKQKRAIMVEFTAAFRLLVAWYPPASLQLLYTQQEHSRMVLMAAVPTRLMTVAEFEQLPEDKGPVSHELRHGEVVAVPRPKFKHALIQRNLRHLLEPSAHPGSYVEIEVAYRPLPEHELWVADVAYLSPERFRATDPEGYVFGAPELVIEVLSPSNTAAEMLDKEQLCLANGGREFWIVNSERKQVKVTTSEGSTKTYQAGDRIPLPLLGGVSLAVDQIFERE